MSSVYVYSTVIYKRAEVRFDIGDMTGAALVTGTLALGATCPKGRGQVCIAGAAAGTLAAAITGVKIGRDKSELKRTVKNNFRHVLTNGTVLDGLHPHLLREDEVHSLYRDGETVYANKKGSQIHLWSSLENVTDNKFDRRDLDSDDIVQVDLYYDNFVEIDSYDDQSLQDAANKVASDIVDNNWGSVCIALRNAESQENILDGSLSLVARDGSENPNNPSCGSGQ